MGLNRRQEVVLIVALEEELPREVLPEFNIEYSGVGKINATFKALEIVNKYNPKLIINFGTAGSLKKDLCGLYKVSQFFQRDMDATALGFKIGETPFEERSVINFGEKGLSCGTGDSFMSNTPELKTDLVDMEAYAIAKVCLLKKIEFLCFKYVSDNADENSSKNWKANVSTGASAFKDMLRHLDLSIC